MARCLSAVASVTDGQLTGNDADFGFVGTDTRTLPEGSLFVAIQGETFDGNQFVAQAAERGAVGAMVSALQSVPLPQIKVRDTRRAFAAMARAWRRNFDVPVVAVTGSAGKTTVKELVGAILGQGQRVCVTEGNLNNEIGVPLSLMRVSAEDDAVVVELGANHAGEIALLGAMVEPTIAIITNAGAAHLEGFGSIAGVAKAKGELIDALSGDGVAILNADDDYFGEWRQRAGDRKVISFGLDASADVHPVGTIDMSETGSHFCMSLPEAETVEVELALPGQANIKNALAAAAAAFAAGATALQIREGLKLAKSVRGRMQRLAGANGAMLIDDSYNANPSAARAALDHLATLSGEKIFVLGDMRELGANEEALHREIGEYARDCCDRFVAVGELAGLAAQAFGPEAESYTDIESAAAALLPRLAPEVTVLIKASRSMGLDRLVRLLAAEDGGGSC